MIRVVFMISFKWNETDFNLIQYGRGVFTTDMPGHSHSKNSYELHYIVDGEGLLTTAGQVIAGIQSFSPTIRLCFLGFTRRALR